MEKLKGPEEKYRSDVQIDSRVPGGEPKKGQKNVGGVLWCKLVDRVSEWEQQQLEVSKICPTRVAGDSRIADALRKLFLLLDKIKLEVCESEHQAVPERREAHDRVPVWLVVKPGLVCAQGAR